VWVHAIRGAGKHEDNDGLKGRILDGAFKISSSRSSGNRGKEVEAEVDVLDVSPATSSDAGERGDAAVLGGGASSRRRPARP